MFSQDAMQLCVSKQYCFFFPKHGRITLMASSFVCDMPKQWFGELWAKTKKASCSRKTLHSYGFLYDVVFFRPKMFRITQMASSFTCDMPKQWFGEFWVKREAVSCFGKMLRSYVFPIDIVFFRPNMAWITLMAFSFICDMTKQWFVKFWAKTEKVSCSRWTLCSYVFPNDILFFRPNMVQITLMASSFICGSFSDDAGVIMPVHANGPSPLIPTVWSFHSC